jgi:hypothetical protein
MRGIFERDDVRRILADALHRDIGVGGGADHFDPRIRFQDLSQHLPHRRGIVDDQNTDHFRRIHFQYLLINSSSPGLSKAR